jgi:energy-coupling factor transporter ATP-binding protein EcfA2
MFEKNDEKYLVRLLGRNEVVLFLGSGFSMGAQNRISEQFPSAKQLGKKMWEFLNIKGEYDESTSLPILYDAFINEGIKRDKKIEFLENHLLSGEIPNAYDALIIPYWYKIYSLNIDDVVQNIYKRNGKKLRELIYPIDEFKERDQSLVETNIIHLHGKLPCNPEDVVFSSKQYARAGLQNQPLYSQFVYDYATHPTIFIGTTLDEQLFESYIESREGRSGYGEYRPKSFIIAPSINPVKEKVLREKYNVHFIEGKSDDFFEWLKTISNQLPSKNEILQRTFPNLLNLQEYSNISNVSNKVLYAFAETFKRVPREYNTKVDRSAYLRGANPNWNDIFNNLDIPRTINTELFKRIFDLSTKEHENHKQKIISLLGTAGSGKSTILKRLGLTLSQNGVTTFICDSDFLPKPNEIVDVLMAIEERVVLIFDNAVNVLPLLPNLITSFSHLKNPPIVLLSLRSNQRDRLNFYVNPDFSENTLYEIPDLDDEEIKYLIKKLDDNNLLGQLKGKSETLRFNEFKYRAKKQILVAMKEATNGRSFNDIIESEFAEIDPIEAKILCLCVALNTELGFTNSQQDFVGFSTAEHGDALYYLNVKLAGTIQWVGETGEFMLRHRILADYMIKHCTSMDVLKIAYIRVLAVLAPELVNRTGYTKKFNLYKSLINHQILFKRFQNNIELAREVYESLSSLFGNDAQFWLQYGSLEIEGRGGNLILAENYINQAESLAPHYTYIQNAKCNLYYKMSTAQDDLSHALEYKRLADELAEELISQNTDEDPHISHIHCRGTFEFISKWITDKNEKTKMLDDLRRKITLEVRKYPRDKKLQIAADAINRTYMMQGTSD